MRTVLIVLGRLFGIAVLLAGFAIAFAAALVFTTLPDAREQLAIPTLSAPVTVSLDAQGIPRIQARTERDAAVALGYVHARDRMFQMEPSGSASHPMTQIVSSGETAMLVAQPSGTRIQSRPEAKTSS